MVVIADNMRFPIKSTGDSDCATEESTQGGVTKCHALGKDKEEFVVCVTTNNLRYLRGIRPDDIKIYRNVKIISTPILEGEKQEFVYVMSVETAYIDKTRKKEITDLWHARFEHFSYK